MATKYANLALREIILGPLANIMALLKPAEKLESRFNAVHDPSYFDVTSLSREAPWCLDAGGRETFWNAFVI